MPMISTQPVRIGNDLVTKYEGGATTALQTFTFPSTQETTTVFNDGVRPITLVFSDTSVDVQPNVAYQITDNISSFQVRTYQDSQPFRVEGRRDYSSTSKNSEETLYSTAATAANTKLLISKLKRGVTNASILVIGDSTGNGADEWVSLIAKEIGKKFLQYTVQIRYWNETSGTDYNDAQVVQAGTGAYTLTIWNCSASGQTMGYVQGSRWNNAVVASNPDLIFVSHGHNLGDSSGAIYYETGKYAFLSLTEELSLQFPSAGIVLIAQNPSFLSGRETWQAHKANVIEQVASLRGYGFIDVHQAFVDSGNAQGLTSDGTHPNAEGSKLWSSIVLKAITSVDLSVPTRLNTSTLLTFGKNYLKNPEFTSWASANPDNWTPNGSAVLSKDTANFESGTQGCKITGNATSGGAQIEQAVNFATDGLFHLRGKTVTLAVRVFVPASNNTTVRASVVDGTGSANARSVDVHSTTRDRYVWLFVSKNVPANEGALYIRLLSRTSGTSAVEATFDRAYLVQGILPNIGVV